jgi:hypothetical protein
MASGAQHRSVTPSSPQPPKQTARRRERLRHIHPLTREQQMALIEEARAARLAAAGEQTPETRQ